VTGPLTTRHAPPALAPHPDCSLEWWFVQGCLAGPGIARQHVMAAFFRVRDLDGTGPAGAMLLQNALDEGTGKTWRQSLMTPEVIGHHNAIATQVVGGVVAPRLRDLVMQRYLAHTALSARRNGVVEATPGPVLESAPFAVSWAGFRLTEGPDGFGLATPLTDGRLAELTLEQQSPWMDERSDRLHPGLSPAFAYQCCPRLRATGTAGGRPVTGEFWIDRQWGQYDGWLLARHNGGYRVLGWDWFGLNLEDGRDLMLARYRDAASGRPGALIGVAFENGQTALNTRVHATPTRHWDSPRSLARYPVAWALELPDLGLRGQVAPLIDDQEIPVYGTEAIWEGAVRFDGRHRGRPVAGRGRLELVGYGAALTPAEILRRNLTRLTAGPGRKRTAADGR